MNNLTQKQKDIIKIIEKEPEIKLRQLKKELGYSSISNIGLNIQNLIKKGFLIKKHNRLFLTNKVEKKLYWIPYYGCSERTIKNLKNEKM